MLYETVVLLDLIRRNVSCNPFVTCNGKILLILTQESLKRRFLVILKY